MFLHRVIHFGEKLGDKVKGRSPKKFKILIAVPKVCQVKVHVLRFHILLLSSPWRVLRPSYPYRRNFGRSGKVSFAEKAKIVDRGSVCIASETTCSKVQYDPYLISVPCS